MVPLECSWKGALRALLECSWKGALKVLLECSWNGALGVGACANARFFGAPYEL